MSLARTIGAVMLHEEFSHHRRAHRLIVATYHERWFVLAGAHDAKLDRYDVRGPFDAFHEVAREIQRLQK